MKPDNITFERSVFIPDAHFPFEDNKALAVMLKFIRQFKPQFVFILGDWVDFYQVSRFDKDPERKHTLQDDIDKAVVGLRQIRKSAPNAMIYFLRGNHEFRLTKYLWSRAEELASLRALKVPELLEFKELDINYVESGSMTFHGFLIKHGNLVRARAGYTATGELEKAGVSGVSGHTHRLAQVYKTNFGGTYTWVEAGCVCQLSPSYMEGLTADWQHGFAYGYFQSNNHRFIINTMPIVHGKLVYAGKKLAGD